MNWKTKRWIGTGVCAALPYIASVLITLDPVILFVSAEGRALLLFLTAFTAGGAYSYPGWSWK